MREIKRVDKEREIYIIYSEHHIRCVQEPKTNIENMPVILTEMSAYFSRFGLISL